MRSDVKFLAILLVGFILFVILMGCGAETGSGNTPDDCFKLRDDLYCKVTSDEQR